MTQKELDKYANGYYWAKVKQYGWIPIKLSREGTKKEYSIIIDTCLERLEYLSDVEQLGRYLVSPDDYLENN